MEQEKLKLTSTSSFPEIEDSEGEDSLLEDDVLCDQVPYKGCTSNFYSKTNCIYQCCGDVFGRHWLGLRLLVYKYKCHIDFFPFMCLSRQNRPASQKEPVSVSDS